MKTITLNQVIEDLREAPSEVREKIAYHLLTGEFMKKGNFFIWMLVKIRFYLTKKTVNNPDEFIDYVISTVVNRQLTGPNFEALLFAMKNSGWNPDESKNG